MRWLCRSLKPSVTRPPRRVAAKVARRRLAGWRADGRGDIDPGQAGARQRRHHLGTFPVGIGRVVQVLERAAAADAEMRTGRLGPLRAGFQKV